MSDGARVLQEGKCVEPVITCKRLGLTVVKMNDDAWLKGFDPRTCWKRRTTFR